MISQIQIENFKSIGERITVDMAPITLLYGENSCGKSSIIQAIHLLDEVLNNGRADVDTTRMGGEYSRLGGLSKYLHGRDHKRSAKIRVQCRNIEAHMKEIDVNDVIMKSLGRHSGFFPHLDKLSPIISSIEAYMTTPELYKWGEPKLSEMPIPFGIVAGGLYFLMSSSSSIYAEFTLSSDVGFGTNGISGIEIGINDAALVQFREANNTLHSLFHFSHSAIPNYNFSPFAWNEAIQDFLTIDTSKNRITENVIRIKRKLRDDRVLSNEEVFQAWLNMLEDPYGHLNSNWKDRVREATSLDESEPLLLELQYPQNAFDSLLNPYAFEPLWDRSYLEEAQLHNLSDEDEQCVEFYAKMCPAIILRVCAEQLQRSLYIGPLRNHYPNHSGKKVQNVSTSLLANWEDGDEAWTHIAKSDVLAEKANHWLTDKSHFGFTTKVVNFSSRLSKAIEAMTDSPEQASEIIKWQQLIIRNSHVADLVLEDTENGLDLSSRDIGVGFAQIFPVVVAALLDGKCLVCLEQPELHLHARLQAVLADLVLSTIQGNTEPESTKQYLIESHSEYLLLRIMRRIRETRKELPGVGARATCDDVAVYHIRKVNGQTRADRLELDEYGNLISEWPDSLLEIGFWEKFGE